MNRYDKLFYDETIAPSGVSEQDCFLVDSQLRQQIIQTFVNEEEMRGRAYPRYFEALNDGEVFGYGQEGFARLLRLQLSGHFFMFIEQGSVIYQVKNWETVRKLLSEWGSTDLYLVPEDCKAIICLTNENNVIIGGDWKGLGLDD